MSVPPPAVAPRRFSEHVKILASDTFEGRAPGSRGERLTVDYLCRQFEQLGLQPGNGESFIQTVPMIETLVEPATALHIRCAGESLSLAFGRDMVIGSPSGEPEVTLQDSELVFAGYGIDAPEQDWNDYGVDVRGKTVVVLVNDPGFHTGDAGLFSGRRMTAYGRWPYKCAAAARHGAAAALIIHEDAAAGYGWGVVESGAAGPRFSVPADVDPAPRLPLQGWLTADAATLVFRSAGLDLGALRRAAAQRGFKPVPLNARLSTTVSSSVRAGESSNVLAMIPGSERAEEVVAYAAHWDHLGRNTAAGTRDDGADIRNGAVDNATGVAAMLEIARAFAAQPRAPKRTVVFAALTLEESGLLGSRYLVTHLPWSLAKTVAVLNFDALDPAFDNSERMPLVGYGSSELEEALARIVAAQGRRLVDEPEPEKGLYFRSDHYSFAAAGVPGLVSGLNLTPAYAAHQYHQPSDVYRDDWDVTGIVLDVDAMYRLGLELAASEAWPAWYPHHPFRVIGEALRGAAPERGA
jgi:Zn-dependent M28 family amino/carboxypeptidase